MWFQQQPVARQRSFPESDLHIFLQNKIPTMFVAKKSIKLEKEETYFGAKQLNGSGWFNSFAHLGSFARRGVPLQDPDHQRNGDRGLVVAQLGFERELRRRR